MKTIAAVLATLGLLVGLSLAPTAQATNDQVCGPLDSGKIDTTGDPQTVTVTAPEGQLIDGYCVKAGSSKQGDGPVYVTVDPPVQTITFGHPSGKAVSHYSVSYVPVPTHADADSYSHADSHAYADPHTYTHTDAHTDADSHPDADNVRSDTHVATHVDTHVDTHVAEHAVRDPDVKDADADEAAPATH